jgi:hypothetical protein
LWKKITKAKKIASNMVKILVKQTNINDEMFGSYKSAVKHGPSWCGWLLYSRFFTHFFLFSVFGKSKSMSF